MSKKKRRVIVGIILLVVAVALSVASGIIASNRTDPSNSIQQSVKESFKDSSYFVESEVKVLLEDKGTTENVNAVNILITVNRFTAEDFDDFLTNLPETQSPTYYQVNTEEGSEDEVHMIAFTQEALQDETIRGNVRNALTLKDEEQISYMDISLGDVTVTDLETITVTFLSPENTVESTRSLAERLASESVDVAAVNSYTSDMKNYVQTVVEDNNWENFNELVQFGLLVGEEVMTDGTSISVMSFTGTKEATVTYSTLPEGMTGEQLVEVVEQNNTQGFTVAVEPVTE